MNDIHLNGSGVVFDAPTHTYTRETAAHGLTAIAGEYIVTDGERYASPIDIVFADKDGNIVLGDVKTTSKYDGEYVSWQLSVYAKFFEMQNPSLKVSSLVGVWLRGDMAEIVPAARKDMADVDGLLYDDDFHYESAVPDYISCSEELYIELSRRKAAIEEQLDKLRQGIMESMEKQGAKSVDTGRVIYTIKAAGKRSSFDSKAFKADNAELYGKYVKETVTPVSMLIKIRQ